MTSSDRAAKRVIRPSKMSIEKINSPQVAASQFKSVGILSNGEGGRKMRMPGVRSQGARRTEREAFGRVGRPRPTVAGPAQGGVNSELATPKAWSQPYLTVAKGTVEQKGAKRADDPVMNTGQAEGRGQRTRAGFTLIEALLAVAIMSMSAFAFLSLTSQCLGVASLSRRYHDAVMIMDRGNLDHPLLMTNEVYDNVVAPVSFDGGYVFTRNVVEDEDEEDLFIVRTRVSWSKRGKKSFEEVETYIYSTNHP